MGMQVMEEDGDGDEREEGSGLKEKVGPSRGCGSWLVTAGVEHMCIIGQDRL